MRATRSSALALALAFLSGAGCAESEGPPPVFVTAPVAYETHVLAGSGRAPAARVDPERSGRVLILHGRKLERPAEVVGVVDAHEPSGRQDAALAQLRERAAALGADAVVGVEFHHGEAHGEPIHLSGLAVRYLDQTP